MINPRLSTSTITVLAVAFGLAWAPPAAAQSYGQPENPAATERSFSQEDLKAYALAALDVQGIRQSYHLKLQSAETPGQQVELQKEATDRMVNAVRGQGLSVEKYNMISNAAQSDAELNKRINTYMREAQ